MFDDDSIFTGVALALRDDQLSGEVARQMLAGLKAERGSTSLVEAVRLAAAADISIAEMQRMSGYTRPTLYAAKKQLETTDARPDDSLLTRHVLAVVAGGGGSVPVQEIARRLRYSPAHVAAALRVLAAQGLCDIDPAGGPPSTLSAVVTHAGKQTLRAIFDDLFLRRPDGYSVYIRVDPAERSAMAAAAEQVMSTHLHTVIDASVAPSRMTGPELALGVNAPSSRIAVSIAHDIWREVRRVAGLPPAQAWVADVIPPAPLPASESAVLDAFVEGIVGEAPEIAGDVTRARMRFAGGVDERTLTGRCLTAAALAVRRAAGNTGAPRPITNGDEAAEALLPTQAVPVERKYRALQRAACSALERAADRLGPIRGGELGSFRSPAGSARVVAEVEPTPDDLVELATDAGRAVGAATKLDLLDATKQMVAIVAPIP